MGIPIRWGIMMHYSVNSQFRTEKPRIYAILNELNWQDIKTLRTDGDFCHQRRETEIAKKHFKLS
jgi:hypothetical protein